MIAKFRT